MVSEEMAAEGSPHCSHACPLSAGEGEPGEAKALAGAGVASANAASKPRSCSGGAAARRLFTR